MWNEKVMTESEKQKFVEQLKAYSKSLLDAAEMLEQNKILPDISCVVGSTANLVEMLSDKIEVKNQLWYKQSKEHALKIKAFMQ